MSILNSAVTRGFLYTDQYQLAMAQLYLNNGMHDRLVQFDFMFREYPDYGTHQAGYCLCAGVEPLLQWMLETRISKPEQELLRNQFDPRGKRVFDDRFVEWLDQHGRFDCVDICAVPEGRTIHPHTPVLSVRGPLGVCQILETALVNHLAYPILVATKASRIRMAGQQRPVLEFGLRRAQSWAANAGTRAALIGGAAFSSNVGMSHALDLPPKGTHAHSMVQMFLGLGYGEIDAFRAFADTYPDNCILLVDTVDTLNSGIPNAITVFNELRKRGHEPRGVRLDSGDLAFLSIEAAKRLDEAGFRDVAIVLSNDLDEMALWQIVQQIRDEGSRAGVAPEKLIQRLMYGVGTHLVTSLGAPALKAAYKLVAVHHRGEWRPTVKISESPSKTPTPGAKQLWRLYDRRQKATADVVAAPEEDLSTIDSLVLHHPMDPHKGRTVTGEQISESEPLCKPMLANGRRVEDPPDLNQIRSVRERDLERLDVGVRRLIRPHTYHVSLTQTMWNTKTNLVETMTSEA